MFSPEAAGEDEPADLAQSAAPARPSPLPPDLAQFLRDRTFACLTHPTDQGTILVIKAPGREIESLRGRVPIRISHELYDHPSAPVIRMVLTIYDQPERPLALETFINVEDQQQRSDYEGLTGHDELLMLFYDEGLVHRLTKAVKNLDGATMRAVLNRADELFRAIPRDQFDFDAAKAAVVARTTL